jgi:hypothetical protein
MSKQKIQQDNETPAQYAARLRRNKEARAIRQAYKDCGMVRVRGAMGGIYYE